MGLPPPPGSRETQSQPVCGPGISKFSCCSNLSSWRPPHTSQAPPAGASAQAWPSPRISLYHNKTTRISLARISLYEAGPSTPGRSMQFQVSLDPAQSRPPSPVSLHVQGPTGLPLNLLSQNPQVTSQVSYLRTPHLEFLSVLLCLCVFLSPCLFLSVSLSVTQKKIRPSSPLPRAIRKRHAWYTS